MLKEQALIESFNELKDAYTYNPDASFGETNDTVLFTIAQDIICPMLSLSFEKGCKMWEYELSRYSDPKIGNEMDYFIFSEVIFEYGDFDIFVRAFSENDRLAEYVFKNNRYVTNHSEGFIAKLIFNGYFDLADKLLTQLMDNTVGENDPQTLLFDTLNYSVTGSEARWKISSEGIDFVVKWAEMIASNTKRAQIQAKILSVIDCVEGDAPRGAMPFSMINEEGALERLAADKAKKSVSSKSHDAYSTIIQNRAEKRISAHSDKKSLVSSSAKGIDETALTAAIDKLQSLVGLGVVKTEVTSLCNFMKIRLLREARNFKVADTSQHLVFVGNPGTGKTTVARLIGEIYHALGFLSKGQFVEVDRSELVAGYVGQTAIKTQKVIASAIGGVLFIDEAYALAPKYPEDYGAEAIDTLVKAMEDNREDFVVIVAGYEDQMNSFINSNPGLRSRFNKYIHFPDYNGNELLDIFLSMLETNNYAINIDALRKMTDYFYRLYRNRDNNFGNAREVRNVFETIITNQANRLAKSDVLSDKEIMEITISDLQGIIPPK